MLFLLLYIFFDPVEVPEVWKSKIFGAGKSGKLIILLMFCFIVSVKGKERRIMKMTEKEYRELIAHFNFLADKADPAYEREVQKVVERLEEEYKRYVIK